MNDDIENVKKIHGCGCGDDTNCEWPLPGVAGEDRDRLLLEEYCKLKTHKPDDILYWS